MKGNLPGDYGRSFPSCTGGGVGGGGWGCVCVCKPVLMRPLEKGGWKTSWDGWILDGEGLSASLQHSRREERGWGAGWVSAHPDPPRPSLVPAL